MIQLYNDDFFMGEALKEAKKAFEKDEVPVGSVVVCGDQIVARAHNLTETLQDATAHAEMLALTSAFEFFRSKYLTKCSLYVSLEPCMMCAGAAYWAQLDRLVFGASDPKRGYLRFNAHILHPKTKLTKGVRAEESLFLLQEFFASKRN